MVNIYVDQVFLIFSKVYRMIGFFNILYIISSEWGVNLLDSICDDHVDCSEWLYMILLLIDGFRYYVPPLYVFNQVI